MLDLNFASFSSSRDHERRSSSRSVLLLVVFFKTEVLTLTGAYAQIPWTGVIPGYSVRDHKPLEYAESFAQTYLVGVFVTF